MSTTLASVFLVLSISFSHLILVSSEEATGCSINLNKDLPKSKSPLILKNEGNKNMLLLPEIKNRQGVIELDEGEEIMLACPGKGNSLREVRKGTTVKTSCLSNTKLSDNNSKATFEMKNADCVQQPTAVVKDTGKRCAQVGKLYEIGFEAEGWHQMVTVCHDTSQSNTLYSQHTLIGSALRGAERESDRPRFSDGDLDELYKGFNPDTYYKKKSQGNLFKTVVGNKKASDYYEENGDKYLSRGHLAPDADFIFGTWQFATYFYINAAPQWQTVNGKNWLTVEKLVRKLGNKVKNDLTVVTGTHGILELEDDKGKPQKIYLNNQKRSIPVPLYYWKVVYDPKSKNGIAIVTSNNPYLKTGSKISFCKDICDANGWTNSNNTKEFRDISQGLTICCTVNDLRKTVTYAPIDDIRGVLRGPY